MNLISENQMLLSSCGPCEGLQANLATNLHVTTIRLAEAVQLVKQALEFANEVSGETTEKEQCLQQKLNTLLRTSTTY
jgi:hypothetical protein